MSYCNPQGVKDIHPTLLKDAIDNFKYLVFSNIRKNGNNIDHLADMSPKDRTDLFNNTWNAFETKVLEKPREAYAYLKQQNPDFTKDQLQEKFLQEFNPLKNNIELIKQKEAFITEFSNSLKDLKLNLTFKAKTHEPLSYEDLLDKEFGEEGREGIVVDKFGIDNADLASLNLRLFFASFADEKYHEGAIVPNNSWFGIPKTVDYDFVNRTMNSIALDAENTFQILTEFDKRFRLPSGRYKEGYLWGKELREGLNSGDLRKPLSPEDVRLITAFETYLKGTNYAPKQLIMNKGGENTIMDTINHRNELDAVDAWENNVLANIMSEENTSMFSQEGAELAIDRESKAYKDFIEPTTELPITLEKLKTLGVEMPVADILDSQDTQVKLNDGTTKSIKNIVEDSYKGIVAALTSKKVSPQTFDALFSESATGRFRNLARVYNEIFPANKRFTILNADNKAQYMRQSQSVAAQQSLKINNLKSIADLETAIPYYKAQGYLTPQRNIDGQIVMSPTMNVLFNESGQRRTGSKYEIVLQQGIRSRETDEGTKESNLVQDDQLLYATNLILNNTYPLAMNGDKTMSYAIQLSRPYMFWRDVNGENGKQNITETFLYLLRDEMDCAWMERVNPKNIKTFSNEIYKLGIFGNILPKDLLKQFIEEGYNCKIENPTKPVTAWKITKNTTQLGTTPDFTTWREKFIQKNYKSLQNAIVSEYINNNQVTAFIDKLEELNIIKLAKDGAYKLQGISKNTIEKFLGQDIFGEDSTNAKRMTYSQLEDLARYVLTNYAIARVEQDKLHFGNASYYKDPFKRWNMFTAIKTQMTSDEAVVKALSPTALGTDGFLTRVDKRQDTISATNPDKFIRVICHADHIFQQEGYENMAEEWFKQQSASGLDKKQIETIIGAEFNSDETFKKLILIDSKPVGLVSNYIGTKGADSYSHMIHDFYWNYRQRLGDMENDEYKIMKYDWAYNIEGLSNLNSKEYPGRKFDFSSEVKQRAKEILKEFNNICPDVPINSIKPQASTFTDSGVPVAAKTAPSYLTWRIAEGTEMENVYLDAIEKGIDWIMPESAQKFGNPQSIPHIANLDGSMSLKDKDFPVQNWYPEGMGKQSEITEHDSVKGSQEAKLIYSNAIANPELEQHMRDSIAAKNELTKKLTKKVLAECAIDGVHTDPAKFYSQIKDALRRSGISEDKLESFNDTDMPFDASSIKSQIENMCWSKFNDDIVNPHHPGIQATQIHSIGIEPIKWSWINPETGRHEQLNAKQIVEKGLSQKDLHIISPRTDIPRIENGKIQPVKVIMGWPFKGVTPKQLGLDRAKDFSKGTWDLSKAKIDPDLLRATMIRIPTPSINSIHYVQFPRVFDASRGNIVGIGSGIVVIGGSDFDGDKMQVFFRSFNVLKHDLESKEFKELLSKRILESDLSKLGVETEEQKKDLIASTTSDLIYRINNAAETDAGRDLHIQAGTRDNDHESIQDIAAGNDASLEYYKLVKDVLQHYKTPFGDNKKRIIKVNPEEDSVKGIRNKLMDYREKFLEHPANYSAVTTPLLIGDLEAQAKRIDDLKGIKDDDSNITKNHELITTLDARRQFIDAKKGLGPAARAFSQHIWNQVAQFRLTGHYKVPGQYTFLGLNEPGKPKTIYNPFTTERVPLLGQVYNEGHQLISEALANLTQAILEAAKNPTAFKLGINTDNIGAIFNQLLQGAEGYKIALLATQPIVQDFLQARKLGGSLNYQTNIAQKDVETGITESSLSMDKIVTKLLSKYGTTVKDAVKSANLLNKFTQEQLESGLAKKTDQGAFLIKYLEMEMQGSPAFTFNQRINSDTVAIKTFMELKRHKALSQKVASDDYIDNPEALDKTFITEIDNATSQIMQGFDKYFMTLHPAFSDLNDTMLNFVGSHPMDGDARDRILNKFTNHTIDFLLQTLPNPQGEFLSTKSKDLMIGENSMGMLLADIKKSKAGAANLWKNLQPIINQEGNANTMKILKMNPTPHEIKLLIDEVNTNSALSKNPKIQEFVRNLAGYNILQAGLNSSRNSINKIVPYKLHKDVVEFVFSLYKEHLAADTMHDWISPDLQNSLQESFFRTNWSDENLIKSVKKLEVKDGDEVGDYSIVPGKPGIIFLPNAHAATKYDYIKNVKYLGKGEKKTATPTLFRKLAQDKNKTYYSRINPWGRPGIHVEINPTNQQSIHPENKPFDENAEEFVNNQRTLLDKINVVPLPEDKDLEQGDLFNQTTAESKTGEIEKIKPGIEKVKNTGLTPEQGNSFIDLLQPFILQQSYKENKGKNANDMFHIGLMWSRRNDSRYPNKSQPISIKSRDSAYGYTIKDQQGRDLPKLTQVQPILDFIQSKLGIDMSNYDSMIGNIYEENTFISQHRDITESSDASKYPVIVINLGADGKILFGENADTKLGLTNGSIYAFGINGENRYESHRTVDKLDSNTPLKPLEMPNGKSIKDYRITLTFRRAQDLTPEMPKSPKRIGEPVATKPGQITKMSDLTDHSGGAYGADTDWDIIGRKEFGLTDFRHYREEGNASLSKRLRDLGVKATIVSKEDLATGYAELEKVFGKKFSKSLENDLKARNYLQVKNSDAVFAIGTFKAPEVDKSVPDNTIDSTKSVKSYKFTQIEGGTNAAVQMAIAVGKPVHVFDLTSKTWNVWNGTKFVQEETPILTKNFAGIGTRDIENYSVMKDGQWVSRPSYKGMAAEKSAQNAIRDVYKKTQESIGQPTTPSEPIPEEKNTDIVQHSNFANMIDNANKVVNSGNLIQDVDGSYSRSKEPQPNLSYHIDKISGKKIYFDENGDYYWSDDNSFKVYIKSKGGNPFGEPIYDITPVEPINWQDKISEIYQQKYGNAPEIVQKPSAKITEPGRYITFKGETYIVTKFNKNDTIQIYNPLKEGVEAKKSIAGRNLELLEYKANIVTYKDIDYIVTPKNTIISLKTNKVMNWGEENGDRKNILDLANPQEKPTKSKEEFVSKSREIYKIMKQANATEESILDAIKCL